MNVKFNCGQCGQSLEVPQEMAGQTVDCPNCHSSISIPAWVPPACAPPAAAATAGVPPLPVPPRTTSGLAVASLVLGILGLLLGWLCCGLALPVLAIVFGHIAYAQINAKPAVLTGKGLAVAGFVLGYISMALTLIVVLLVGMFVALADALS